MRIKSVAWVSVIIFAWACSSSKPVEKKVEPAPVIIEVVKPVVHIEGEYKVEGKGAGPAGYRYEGILTAAKDGEKYKFEMKMKTRIIKGAGTLTDKILTINWNNKNFVYEVQDDGRILSKWEAGKGEENFIPVKK